MKKMHLLALALLVFTFSGCEVIGGIFKAGAAVGVISVIVVLIIIIWIISAFRGRS
ncbi:phosphatidate cytidylyltransferase [Mucilaginibacter conchicola]|uniref:Phosphatidate cytidylyltransferase n=1 Tax=Mucilaginibacter conchicola TaxID=2303333 RepID=A0A372NQZ5_9SPHI|nr:phosphatidate cytidylyltransferase [Mucilaginibacter conchicola]RFZ91362.1 phosphatidate cytidylyltransferase [Mucilaginibacter conchicola]